MLVDIMVQLTRLSLYINKYSTAQLVPYTKDEQVGGQGSGEIGIVSYYSSNITTQRDHDAQLYISAGVSPSCISCVAPEEGMDIIVDVYIRNLTDAINERRILREFTSTNETITLLGNKTYQIELKVRGDYVDGFVELQCDTAAQDTYYITWHDEPGVRVREIISSDSVTNLPTHKFYKYSSINNLNTSSGLPIYGPIIYTTNAYTATIPCNTWLDWKICISNVLTSNSNAYQYFYDNNPYVYSTIIESNDLSFKNGAIEHVYAAEGLAGYSSTLMGDEMLQMPTNTYTWHHGYELATNYYDSSLRLVKAINNYFHEDTAVNKFVRGNVVRAKYWCTPPLPGDPVVGIQVDEFDVGEYFYHSQWIQYDSTVTKEYDILNHLLTSKVSNFYGNPINILPVRIETIDSKGLVLKEEKRYPTDSTATTPYQRMIDKNIISPLIESKTYRNNNLNYTTKSNFHDYSESLSAGYPVIIKPQTIQTQKASGSSETRIRFHKYDTKGNPIEMSKENDLKLAYIWDYNKDYPVAEIKNADSSVVAFTSFETTGTGNWTGINTSYIDATSIGITGKKYYNQASFSISKSGLNSGETYIVSYWTKNTSAYSITGTISGYPISGRTSNGWKYFEHHITGQTSITITGSGTIDELRLYPATAQMATYTYDPLIGMTSQCDANNRIIYYDYDGFGRLSLVRDQDRNIVKKICYNYAGQAEDCSPNYYLNVLKSGNFTRNNCSSGYAGTTATYTVPAGTYISIVSQVYVDSLAQADVNANGQAYANTNGSCLLIYYNVVKSGNFTRNNCATGGTGSTVTYTVAASTYSSTTSQSAADQLAQNDVNNNGQAYANSHGICTYYNTALNNTFTRNNCDPGYIGTAVVYTVPANTYSSTTSQAAADALAQADADANGQAYANANGSCNCDNTSCSNLGVDHKCVYGYCDVGIKTYISSVFNKPTGLWTCTYVYYFADCSASSQYTEIHTSSCTTGFCH